VSVTEPPAQNAVGPDAVITGCGGTGFAVTTVGADVDEQPPELVTVTVYEPEADAVIDCVVAPFDHV